MTNNPSANWIRRLRGVPVLAAGLATLMLAASGVAASHGPLPMKTKNEYAKRSAHFCGKRRRIRFFHRSSVIEYRGFLIPATGRHFPVKLEVKRCMRGRFATVARYQITGKRSGKFKGYFRAPPVSGGRHFRINYFYARAIVGGQVGAKTYFAVTR